MKRISNPDQREIRRLVDIAGTAAAAVVEAVENFNSAMALPREELKKAIAAYNEAAGEVTEFYADLGGQAENYVSEKSERWQDGETGQAFVRWKEELESFELEKVEVEWIDDIEVPDLPDFEGLELPPESPDV